MIKTGKIKDINKNYKDWFIGRFVNEQEFNINSVNNFEVKWSEFDKGRTFPLKEKIVQNPTCKSMAILIRGKFKYSFLTENNDFDVYLMENEGDYIYWTPDINHKIEALDDSVVLTVRWYGP